MTAPLRSTLSTPDDLMEGHKGFDILRATFACKNTNMTVENAFARATSMRLVGRGRRDQAHNLWAKHCLAETKAAHRRSLVDKEQALPHVAGSTKNVPLQNGIDGGADDDVADALVQSCQGIRDCTCRQVL